MKTTKLATTSYDSADYLLNRFDMAAYVAAAKADGDPELIKHAMGIAKRAKHTLQRKTKPEFYTPR
jgi:DNA-binding phage protein